jgi:hypothetical protein
MEKPKGRDEAKATIHYILYNVYSNLTEKGEDLDLGPQKR